MRFIDRRRRSATELRGTFRISLGAVLPSFFGQLAQVGLWAVVLVWLAALPTYDDAFYFSLVTFAALGYGDIALAPGYRIFGARAATMGSLMLGWLTALIFAHQPRGLPDPRTHRMSPTSLQQLLKALSRKFLSGG